MGTERQRERSTLEQSREIIMLRSSVRLVNLLSPLTQSCRYMGRARMWNTKRKPMLIEFNERRQIVELDSMLKKGHVEVPRRSSFSDWNYHAEVKALQARLGEKFDADVLMRALVMESHVDQERMKQEELGVEVSTQLRDNSELAVKGEKIIKTVLTRWLRSAYPLLPEEMISEVRQFLTTEQMLAEVGFHIGLREIILSEEYPLCGLFKAEPGGSDSSPGRDRQRQGGAARDRPGGLPAPGSGDPGDLQSESRQSSQTSHHNSLQ